MFCSLAINTIVQTIVVVPDLITVERELQLLLIELLGKFTNLPQTRSVTLLFDIEEKQWIFHVNEVLSTSRKLNYKSLSFLIERSNLKYVCRSIS